MQNNRIATGTSGVGLLMLGLMLGAGSAASAAESTSPLAPLLQPVVELPKALLSRPMNGEGAIKMLGARLGEVAARAGMSAAELRAALRSDPTLWVERFGGLEYRDPERRGPFNEPDVSNGGSGDVNEQAPLAPLSDTFKLHSKPGSKRVIYLDFDGFTVQSATGGWNGGVGFESLPYDTDGNPAVFGEAERTLVQRVWQAVAEAYAPFDVNVTTEDPGDEAITRNDAADDRYGTRAVIVGQRSQHPVYGTCQCGGFAGVGVFDEVPASEHRRRQPAWIFPGPSSSDMDIASTVNHEVGHTLALRHDGHQGDGGYYAGHGTGALRWAPIMGSGAGIEHWSRGEYPRYSNAAQTNPDDYDLMSQNGMLVRADDFTSAAPLGGRAEPGRFTVDQAGIIETDRDVDTFTFEAGPGPASLIISPAEFLPMLDIRAVLYGPDGTEVAKINDDGRAGTKAAVINRTLTPGPHRLEIEGVGVAVSGTGVRAQGGSIDTVGFTDYGSVGQYRITGTFADSESAQPDAVAGASKMSGNAPLTVQFSAVGSSDADGSIVRHAWDFGDGNTVAEAVSPTHTYTTKGTFIAKLTVTDNAGNSDTASISIQVSAPNAFSFTDVTQQPFNAQVQSNAITVSGLASGTVPVSVTGGEYQIGQGAFTNAPGTVANGATVRVRHTTANAANTAVNTVLNIGGVTDTFTSTTSAVDVVGTLLDTQPNPFRFAPSDNAPRNGRSTSAAIALSGFTSAPISVSPGSQYCLGTVCGGSSLLWVSTPGVITPGMILRVRHNTAATPATTVTTTVDVGGVTATFSSTTAR